LKVVLAAEESAGLQVLRTLIAREHELVSVLTELRGAERGAAVSRVATAAGVSVLPARLVKDAAFADWIRERGVDLFLNVHSLYVAASAVVAAPRIGSFNLHPGPLPAYAGLNAPSWAIYNGEDRHGITLHWMDAGIDTGAVAYAEQFPIAEHDTGLSVAVHCIRLGVPLVERLLDVAAHDPDAIPAQAQAGERRYYGSEPPEGGWLSWARTAREVVDFVRAADYTPFASPWGHPRTTLDGGEIAIVKATRTGEPSSAPPGTVGESGNDGARVACADEAVLVHRVQAQGKTRKASEMLVPGSRLTERAP
jgi:methionyl-tRNA formyltransferase